ncbi:MAG: hypothetical protein JWL64_355 [Frankiales bacterium]|nr:hypothetical protein [Frankiales bacterium]
MSAAAHPAPRPEAGPVAYDPSLGRVVRVGDLEQLARGTFDEAARRFAHGHAEEAAQLMAVAPLEAEELLDVYQRWPEETYAWIVDRGGDSAELAKHLDRLAGTIGERAMAGIAEEWPDFVAAVEQAVDACRGNGADALEAIEQARTTWLGVHDRAVDKVSGSVDIAVRMLGERSLGELWSHLMADWSDAHARRYDLAHQPWEESVRQLTLAIVDGFHAHLPGVTRSGEIELLEETDRYGFRFRPCGSGGRSVASGITDGQPRSGAPYDFAVTTEKHDWAWNTIGICSYCVHCCQLNEVTSIDRLGYPTRVIEPPTWPSKEENPVCTWWIYKHPGLVPDAVYGRVGRTPDRRPPLPTGVPGGEAHG